MNKHFHIPEGNSSAGKHEVERLLDKGALKAKENPKQPKSAPSKEYFSPLMLFGITHNDVLDIFSFGIRIKFTAKKNYS